MQYGWIIVERKIQEHWLWAKDKPFDVRSAWFDLLLSANHKANKFPLGNEMVLVERGSFITSERKLGEKWGWSNTRVRNFLKLLESDGMIIKKTDSKKSTITIVNYSSYQDMESTEKAEKKHKKSTEKADEHHEESRRASDEHTNNNDITMINNDITMNNKNTKEECVYIPHDEKLNSAILDFIAFRKGIKAPMTDKAIKLMINKLMQLSADPDEQIDILNQSIINGWKGLFPLKEAKSLRTNNRAQEMQDNFVSNMKGWLDDD